MGDLGSWLIRARESSGLTLEDAERDTRISRRYLQALEDEQFDVIPAPVYARGFLRSYAQYLGLDPQEAMARYPREDDGYPPQPRAGRAPVRQSESYEEAVAPRSSRAESAAPNRPTWRRPTPLRVEGSTAPAGDYDDDDEEPWEPMIGVDIGVPVPTRRLDRDPAAQTRTAVVVGVAIAAIAFVVLLALVVSRLGDGDNGGSPLPDAASDVAGAGVENADADESATEEPTATAENITTSGDPGTVPSLIGQSEGAAVAAIQAAGYVERVTYQPSQDPEGTVIDQSPDATLDLPAGRTVNIVVSSGPE